jgi:hypothetical protein
LPYPYLSYGGLLPDANLLLFLAICLSALIDGDTGISYRRSGTPWGDGSAAGAWTVIAR